MPDSDRFLAIPSGAFAKAAAGTPAGPTKGPPVVRMVLVFGPPTFAMVSNSSKNFPSDASLADWGDRKRSVHGLK